MESENIIEVPNQPKSFGSPFWKNALRCGLMLAGVIILLDLLTYIFVFADMGMMVGLLISLVTIGIYIGLYIYYGKNYRNKYRNGFITYGQAFLFCLVMAVVSTIVISLYYYIFYAFFDPARGINEAQKAVEIISENASIPDETKELYIQKIMDGANPLSKLTGSLMNNAIFSIVMAAIAALFIRKKEKMNDVVM